MMWCRDEQRDRNQRNSWKPVLHYQRDSDGDKRQRQKPNQVIASAENVAGLEH